MCTSHYHIKVKMSKLLNIKCITTHLTWVHTIVSCVDVIAKRSDLSIAQFDLPCRANMSAVNFSSSALYSHPALEMSLPYYRFSQNDQSSVVRMVPSRSVRCHLHFESALNRRLHLQCHELCELQLLTTSQCRTNTKLPTLHTCSCFSTNLIISRMPSDAIRVSDAATQTLINLFVNCEKQNNNKVN